MCCCACCFYPECHNTGGTVKCVKALKIYMSSDLSISYSSTDLIQATQESNVNIPQMADTLFERAGNASWIVVFKALITTHHLMVHGNEVRSKQLISVILLTWYFWCKQDLRQCPDILNERNNYYKDKTSGMVMDRCLWCICWDEVCLWTHKSKICDLSSSSFIIQTNGNFLPIPQKILSSTTILIDNNIKNYLYNKSTYYCFYGILIN